MKLSLNTWGFGQDLELDWMLATLPRLGYRGVEFRVDNQQKHGVEPELTTAERGAVKARCKEAGIAIVSIASGTRFHEQDESAVRENVARAKQVIELAADLGAPRVRVFGNNFPDGVEREAVMQQVAECLRALAEFGDLLGVEVALEMHGDFCWREAVHTADLADHSNVGLIFNSDRRDVENGSVAHVFDADGDRIHHVHMHHLTDPDFPYRDLIRLLLKRAYNGYLSAETGPTDCDPEVLLAYYALLFTAYVDLASV